MQWRDVPGYEGYYEISETGLIRNWVSWRIIKPRISTDGSYLVNLYIDGVRETLILHRLVAMAFVPQPNAYDRFIKHKDGNKRNCSADNLYWTHSKRPFKKLITVGVL